MTGSSPQKPVEILLVEDNADDADFTVEALKESQIPSNVHVAEDGVEALAFLRREGEYAAAPRPDLILLDLSMPRKNGFEVLDEVKADPSLRRIPIVVLTTSRAEKDILACYDLHANTYVTKPKSPDQLTAAIRQIEDFWFKIAQLPAS